MLKIDRNEITGNITVDNGIFSCTFFQGHFFPVFFTGADGRRAGATCWQDGMTLPDGQLFTLDGERWAEFTVKESGKERFVIAVKGVFCGGNDRMFLRALPGVSAELIWQIAAGSPVIRRETRLSGGGAPARYLLNAPVMRFPGKDAKILFTESETGDYTGKELQFSNNVEVRI